MKNERLIGVVVSPSQRPNQKKSSSEKSWQTYKNDQNFIHVHGCGNPNAE
jgi:hypothetical protein